MTIKELLQKIAATDALPNRWRVQAQKEWMLDGATMPTDGREEIIVEYRVDALPRDAMGADWRRFGTIETSSPLVHTSDWIEKIVVEREVPSAILLPLQAALGSQARFLDLAADPNEDIPF